MNRMIRVALVIIMFTIVSFMFYIIMFVSNFKDSNSISLQSWDYRWGEAPNESNSFLQWLQEKDGHLGWNPTVKLSNPPNRSGNNEMWLRTILPSSDIRDPSLFLQVFEHFQVFVNNKLIYSYGSFDPDKRVIYPGTPPRIVNLPEEALGKPIYIHVYSQSKDIGIVTKPQLGSKSNFILNLLHSGAEQFSFGFLYLVIGLLFIITATSVSRQWIFVSFSIFLLFYGLYDICLTPIIYLFYDSPLFWTYTELISLYIWVGGMLAFVDQMFGHGYYKIVRRLWQLTLICAVISLLCISFTVMTIPEAVIIYQIIILISVVIVLTHIYYHARKGNREAGIFAIGLALVAANGIFDISKYLFWMGYTFPRFTHFSILIFIGILLYLMVNRLIKMIAMMKQTEKMAVVGQMAATVAHEIRNPMTVISGFLQLNRQDIQNPVHFQSIMSEIDRINELISNFLLFSKPMVIKYKFHSLKRILEETVLLFQPMLNDTGVRISLNIQELVPEFLCDPNNIKQVLMNIIKNAIEASEMNGEVRISLTVKANHTLQITISDSGSGISAEHLKRIWEPFFTTKQSGTGLGLMVSLKIIELHKGSIDVKSNKLEGTTFLIKLPISHQWIYEA